MIWGCVLLALVAVVVTALAWATWRLLGFIETALDTNPDWVETAREKKFELVLEENEELRREVAWLKNEQTKGLRG